MRRCVSAHLPRRARPNMPDFHLPPDIFYRTVSTAFAESLGWPWASLGIPEWWDRTEGEGVVFVVPDTGIDISHREFNGQILDAKDFTGSRFGPLDKNSHGTWVAGALVAKRGNNIGGAGIAPKASALIAKVLGDNGGGSDHGIASGLRWGYDKALAQNPKAIVFSNSYGSSQDSPLIIGTIKEIIQDAANRKIFVCFVAAAGNDGGRLNSPARNPSCISVGASDREGKITKFSSRIPPPDIIGPGQDILGCGINDTYIEMTGTSMSTPIVAGVIGLAYAADPKELDDAEDVRWMLKRNATDSGGFALIDPRKMLAERGKLPTRGWTLGPVRLGPVKVSLTVEAA